MILEINTGKYINTNHLISFSIKYWWEIIGGLLTKEEADKCFIEYRLDNGQELHGKVFDNYDKIKGWIDMNIQGVKDANM